MLQRDGYFASFFDGGVALTNTTFMRIGILQIMTMMAIIVFMISIMQIRRMVAIIGEGEIVLVSSSD